jgi:microcystin-dependent protein
MASNATVTNTLVDGQPNAAAPVMQNLNDILTWINTNAVHLDGSKAFTAVPSGPASDPVSANQLARKAYVDAVLPAGMLAPFAGTVAPAGWLLCQGQAVSRSTYSALFGVTSTSYGVGDGSTTFNLPDMRGRVPVGLDSGNAAYDSLSDAGGVLTVTLAEANLPPHAHTINHDHPNTSVTVTVNDNTTDLVTRLSAMTDGVAVSGQATTPWNAVAPPQMAGTAGFGLSNTYSFMAQDYITQHTHTASGSVDLPNFTGNSGNGPGTATAFSVANPYRVFNYIIKF